jgi:hypothetical protein
MIFLIDMSKYLFLTCFCVVIVKSELVHYSRTTLSISHFGCKVSIPSEKPN